MKEAKIICLMGFMGSGKSTVGHALADRLAYDFVDLDSVIEQQQSISIPDIFQIFGRHYFREVESQVLRQVVRQSPTNLVLSLGGGTPCFYDNLAFIKLNSTVVFLNVSPKEIENRIRSQVAQRPLLAGLSNEEISIKINEMLTSRMPIYTQADITIDANNSTDRIVDEIIGYIK